MNSETYYGLKVIGCSASVFYSINAVVKHYKLVPNTVSKSTSRSAWKWRNICTSLLHSILTGLWSILCFYHEPKMAEDLITTYTVLAQTLVGVSLGYFVYDTVDMLANYRGRQTYELLLHHAVIILCFGISLVTQKYIGYAAVALFAEINSIFLHIRQLLQMLDVPRKNSFYRLNSLVNLGTFIVFRIATLAWMTRWIFINRDLIPVVLYSVGSLGLAVMTVINIILLYRLLHSDFISNKDHKKKT